MEEELFEVQMVRDHIARVFQAREAHGLVVGQKDTAVEELNVLAKQRTDVQARLTAREKEIALAGAELPDAPFPEDAEIARLDRHVRILKERVRDWENKVRLSQAEVDAEIRGLEASWSALGAATSARLREDFRSAAAALRDAQQGYLSLLPHFHKGWSSAAWRYPDKRLAIADPDGSVLILDPLRVSIAAKWPPAVQLLQKSMDELRGEIDAVKSGVVTQEAAAPETPAAEGDCERD